MEIPNYLQTYDPNILLDLKVLSVNTDDATFKYQITFYDPTDDIHMDARDESGLVKKTATGYGSYEWSRGLPEDMEPEIENIFFDGLAVSDEMWLDVHEEIYSKLEEIQ